MLPIAASMRGIHDSELESARDLGAPFTAILFDHVIPRCKTGITTGFALCFLIACGDWVTPVLVGGRMTMLGNLIAAQFGEFSTGRSVRRCRSRCLPRHFWWC